jgi:hypothetical protein
MAQEPNNIRNALSGIDRQRSLLKKQFEESEFLPFESKPYKGEYGGSSYQLLTYEKLKVNDLLYKNFINETYGSYENYLQQNRINQSSSVFDPINDYRIDVKIVNKEEAYTSDHISSQEMILEMLSGVCTVFFIKKTNGASRRITGTLEPGFMPTKEHISRKNFFSPLSGERLGIWDINSQSWKSFYIENVFKFIRDESVGTE